MKKNPGYFFLLFLPLVFSFCRESCRCSKDLGCTIMTATGMSSSTVKEKKTFCTDYNYYNDPVLADSVNAFSKRHQEGYTLIDRKDSIYYSQSVGDLRSKETGYYQNLGYSCFCAK